MRLLAGFKTESRKVMRNRGFSLVEVVASLVVMSIAMVAILGLFSYTNHYNAYKKERLIASNLLRRKIEELQCYDFTYNLNTLFGAYSEYPTYDLFVMETTNYASNPNLKKVEVTVAWPSVYWGAQSEAVLFLVSDD